MHITAKDNKLLIHGVDDDAKFKQWAEGYSVVLTLDGMTPLAVIHPQGDQVKVTTHTNGKEKLIEGLPGVVLGVMSTHEHELIMKGLYQPDPSTKPSTAKEPMRQEGFSVASPSTKSAHANPTINDKDSAADGGSSGGDGNSGTGGIFSTDKPMAGAEDILVKGELPEGAIFEPYEKPDKVGWAGWYHDGNGVILGWQSQGGNYFHYEADTGIKLLGEGIPDAPAVDAPVAEVDENILATEAVLKKESQPEGAVAEKAKSANPVISRAGDSKDQD